MKYKAGVMTAEDRIFFRPSATFQDRAGLSRSHDWPSLSPEREMLLCCATTVLNEERQNRIKALLEAGLDWGCLLKEAARHGVIPLLYANLNACFPEAVPEPFANILQEHFRKNMISNLLLTSEMCSILNLLEAHDIPAIPFKGPTLAVAAYNDLALREFRDIDLLVHKADVSKAKAVLRTRGYACNLYLNQAQEIAYLKSENEYGFKGSIYLELQWNIVPRNHSFEINDGELWQHLDYVNIEGIRIAMPSAEDTLLLLCAHGSKQYWKRLSWISDVSELIRARPDLDWDRVFERAKNLGGERMLSIGLLLASSLLGASLPCAVIERISRDRIARTLCERACKQLFSESESLYSAVKCSLFYIKARERLSDKARCYLRMALSPTVNDLRFLSLPPSLHFFYYPLRPIRLLGKYLFTFLLTHT
jgi:hypothetical protein